MRSLSRILVLAAMGLALAAAGPAGAPGKLPWSALSWGMKEDAAKAALGKGVEALKTPYRLGDYVAAFRGAPLQITKGVAMRVLPLFHRQSGALEMIVMTQDGASARDFVEVYQMLVKTYGKAHEEHSQIQGRYQLFDVSWAARGSQIALYFDEGGRLLTLELARGGGPGPDPYRAPSWIRAGEWAALCGCDMPLYYKRCGRNSDLSALN